MKQAFHEYLLCIWLCSEGLRGEEGFAPALEEFKI